MKGRTDGRTDGRRGVLTNGSDIVIFKGASNLKTRKNSIKTTSNLLRNICTCFDRTKRDKTKEEGVREKVGSRDVSPRSNTRLKIITQLHTHLDRTQQDDKWSDKMRWFTKKSTAAPKETSFPGPN